MEAKSETTTKIMQLLRESTKPLHDATEQHEFQGRLASGKLGRDKYVLYLRQLFAIHKDLADLLQRHMQSDPAVDAVIEQRHLDTANLESDLRHFDENPEDPGSPVEGTGKLLEKMRVLKNSRGLLGVLYVLEGSTHGAKYMAKSLREGLGLSSRSGSSYFDRYGDKQMDYWLAFKASMNEQEFDQADCQLIVEMAEYTFQAYTDIGTEILAADS